MRILTTGGLFMMLEDQTSKCKFDLFPLTILPLSLFSNTLIPDFKLDRFKDVKVYFGKPEIQLMIEETLHNSNGHNRESKIQAILILFPFLWVLVHPLWAPPLANIVTLAWYVDPLS